MQWVLEQFKSESAGGAISKLHGQLIPVTTGYGEAMVIPLYHPAVALYKASEKENLKKDFAILKEFI
jgi:DNA polymerase